jgi:glycosyltransferase involved in cell wall biosynthesis
LAEIAVVVPTYRRPELLDRALRSVELAAARAGVLRRLEVMVVDDAPQETGSRSIEAPGALSLRVLRHPRGPRQGAAACRNFGIRAADAKHLFLLDDDDEFLPSRFARSLPLLDSGAADVVLERALRERDGTDGELELFETGPVVENSCHPPFEFLLTQPESGHVATGATSFTRAAFDAAGGIDERLRYGEDGEFLLRLALTCRVALLPGPPVVHVHRHGANTSAAGRLAYWQPLMTLRALRRTVDWRGRSQDEDLLRRVITRKLDFALSRCRLEYGYRRRLEQGFRALAQVPLTILTRRNLRSLVVWLLWPRPRVSLASPAIPHAGPRAIHGNQE